MDKIYNSIIEALIFSSDEPISAADLVKAIKGIDGDDTQISNDEVEKCVDEINANYDEKNISFKIIRIAEGFLFATKPEYGKYVGYLSSEKSKRRLSQEALTPIISWVHCWKKI